MSILMFMGFLPVRSWDERLFVSMDGFFFPSLLLDKLTTLFDAHELPSSPTLTCSTSIRLCHFTDTASLVLLHEKIC